MFTSLLINYFLSQVSVLLPILSISFVSVLVVYKIYIQIRSKFNTIVNCWFCNQNTKVPYNNANSWYCPSCEQYNGFSKDGDYNREIFEQLDCSSVSRNGNAFNESPSVPNANGFCAVCNENQRIKVEKIAQFEPKKESKFDEELKIYKSQLEEQYRLCTTCDRHLKRVLHEKKKMVLGSKFLDLILKGTETLRNGPQFQQMKNAHRQKIKSAIRLTLVLFAVINLLVLLKDLPSLSKDILNTFLPQPLGGYVFIAFSHMLALSKVLGSYLENVMQFNVLQKIQLFVKTLFLMMMYSMGLKSQQLATVDFGALLSTLCPLGIMFGSFLYKLVDRFRISRYTLLLSIWSISAAGCLDDELLYLKDAVIFVASVTTAVLCLKHKDKVEKMQLNTTASSFHRIYSEDYLSDESRDTVSMLNGSCNSNASVRSYATSPIYMMKSPVASSDLNLNRTQISPFKSFDVDAQSVRSSCFAGSTCNFPTNRSLFASNIELNRRRVGSVLDVNTSLNNSFVNQSLNSGNLNHTRAPSRFSAAPPLASPFSYSSSNVYQRSNLLSPSRFSTNSLLTAQPAASWVSGGFFNAPKSPKSDKINFFLNGGNMSGQNENLSRASSHSSGFESHSSLNNNISRENSFCPEPEFFPTYPPVQEMMPASSAALPYPSQSMGSLLNLSSSSMQPNNSFRPLTLDCQQDYYKPARSANNAFNLNKINEELPLIQRGSLLSKWKEQQTLSS